MNIIIIKYISEIKYNSFGNNFSDMALKFLKCMYLKQVCLNNDCQYKSVVIFYLPIQEYAKYLNFFDAPARLTYTSLNVYTLQVCMQFISLHSNTSSWPCQSFPSAIANRAWLWQSVVTDMNPTYERRWIKWSGNNANSSAHRRNKRNSALFLFFFLCTLEALGNISASV